MVVWCGVCLGFKGLYVCAKGRMACLTRHTSPLRGAQCFFLAYAIALFFLLQFCTDLVPASAVWCGVRAISARKAAQTCINENRSNVHGLGASAVCCVSCSCSCLPVLGAISFTDTISVMNNQLRLRENN